MYNNDYRANVNVQCIKELLHITSLQCLLAMLAVYVRNNTSIHVHVPVHVQCIKELPHITSLQCLLAMLAVYVRNKYVL